ncbi:prepilin-type N-terminal cleavage/methylation domain-containing protein [Candidatus Saccharibacteria bacterium]|nr:prepilin-type N-terminal cleavage/methylation domain-containing protein [Candidatus Saccharibacteria bacterium]
MKKAWARQQTGFTIVELLIVIVVIGILAAISIVAYSSVRNSAQDSAVKSDLVSFAKIMGIQKAENGQYPATLIQNMGIKASKGAYGVDFQGYNFRYCLNAATDAYVLLANSKSGKYFVSISGGTPQETASTYGWGVCSQVGLVNINPSQNGYYPTAWGTWIN